MIGKELLTSVDHPVVVPYLHPVYMSIVHSAVEEV